MTGLLHSLFHHYYLLLFGDFVGIERKWRMDDGGRRLVSRLRSGGHAHGFLFLLDEVEGILEGDLYVRRKLRFVFEVIYVQTN